MLSRRRLESIVWIWSETDSHSSTQRSGLAEIAEAAACRLVSAQRWDDCSYIDLPLIFPAGGPVTVKLARVKDGIRVSDHGFAFRELESIGAERSFPRTAAGVAKAERVEVDRRALFVDVPEEQIVRAICDVAMASWQVADRVYSRVEKQEKHEIEDYLRDRLADVFDHEKLKEKHEVKGHSTSDWNISAIVLSTSPQAQQHKKK